MEIMRNFCFIVKALCILSTQLLMVIEGELEVGFYSESCPNAEDIISSVVRKAAASNSRMPAFLLRLHFHDCYVQGCDGSILIDNVEDQENMAFGHQGVQGYQQIQTAKTKLEDKCPGVVSCSDIIAIAARDAVSLSGGPFYKVETGRRDGWISNVSLAADMPDVNDSIRSLKTKFRRKGLTRKDLVLLTAGGHTIGTTACFFMPTRLYNFTGNNDADPSIDPKLLKKLKASCPVDGDINARIPLDPITSNVFDDQVFRNIKNGFAVIASDARLYDNAGTRDAVDYYLNFTDSSKKSTFGADFAKAMVKMGRMGVKTGEDGEIRRVCNSFN